MLIRLYQINSLLDASVNNSGHRNIFRDFDASSFDRSLYELTFEGDVSARDAEEVYEVFNRNKPEGFEGRSLSVSDIVEIESCLYYCQTFGWENITDFVPAYENVQKFGVFRQGVGWLIGSGQEQQL